MKIIISNEAIDDIREIYRYIKKDSEKYAKLTVNNIYSSIYLLDKMPYIGRYIPEISDDKYREIIFKNYRIGYNVSSDSNIIYIRFVIHSKRDLSNFFSFETFFTPFSLAIWRNSTNVNSFKFII